MTEAVVGEVDNGNAIKVYLSGGNYGPSYSSFVELLVLTCF